MAGGMEPGDATRFLKKIARNACKMPRKGV